MTTLNLGYLATFRLVIQRGSFSAAADVLGISQPALSKRLKKKHILMGGETGMGDESL